MFISDNQSLFDVAIQRMGSAEAALTVAILNGLSITDPLEAGHGLLLSDVVNGDIAGYFSDRNIAPATAGVDIIINEPVVVYSGLTERIESGFLVADNQSLFDVAIQRMGSAEAALTIALLNNLSITDTLEAGRSISAPLSGNMIVEYYKNKGIVPGTSVTDESDGGGLILEGIGYWAIGVDFVVS